MTRHADIRYTLAPYIGLTLVWIALVLLVNPLGDFPISDDWAYARSVRDLLSTGRLKFSDWGAMNLITHVAWGTLFSSIFGPSYTALRFSTLFLALGGAWSVFYLCRRAGVKVSLSLLATATSVLNPIYFFYSFSFMTDVPYAAVQMVAIAMLAGRDQLVRQLGWAAALWSLLCRQTGLAIAGAWGVAELRSQCSIRRASLAVFAVSLFIAIQVSYQYGLKLAGILPKNQGHQIKEIISNFIYNPSYSLGYYVKYSIFYLLYIGIFSIPITLPITFSWLNRRSNWAYLIISLGWLILTITLCFIMLKLRWFFPMFEDTISQAYGIGTEYSGSSIPPTFAALLTIAAAGSSIIFLATAIYALTVTFRSNQDKPTNMLVVLAIALFLPIPFLSHPFDRYLIPILPCVAVVLAVACRELRLTKLSIAVGIASTCIMATMSVAATHDFLAWKRIQKVAYTYALTLAPAEKVDAGWVLNGERFFPAFYGRTNLPLTWHIGQDYRIVPYPERGYKIIRRYSVPRWLIRGNELLVLHNSATLPLANTGRFDENTIP